MRRRNKVDVLNIADIYRELDGGTTDTQPTFEPTTPTTPPPNQPQAGNQLRNGSFAHSVGSWANVATADNRRYECEHWYSHPDVANHPMHVNWNTATTGAQTFVDANVTVGTGTIAIANHGYQTSDAIRLTTTGVLPSAYALVTTYYVIRVDANSIRLATTIANSLVPTPITGGTAAGGGTHTVTPTNFLLKSDDHASYSSSQSNWTRQDPPAGCSRINQTYTMDAPLAQPTAEPGYTMFCVFNVARYSTTVGASQYIHAPSTARIGCGLYARQNGTWNYLQGNFTVTATTSGTIATPTSRDYVVHTRTSRGFTVQSSVTTVAGAPSDTDFTNGAVVVLSWPRPLQYGVIGYDVYRNTGGTFRLLERIETGLTSYIDNNSYLDVAVAGYPAADFTKLTAFTATIDGVLGNLAADGIDDNWDTLPFAVRVPSNYDHSLTDFDRKQWVRWKLSGLNSDRFDIRVTGTMDAADPTLTSSAGQFTAGMVGLTVVVTQRDGSSVTKTIASFTSATEVELNNGTSIVGGAVTAVVQGAAPVNSLAIDLAHCSFGENSIFAFHPDDLSPDRGVPPVAANGSNQGGTTTLPTTPNGDGTPHCPWENELITVTDGAGSIFQKKAIELEKGDYTIYGNRIGQVADIQYKVADVYRTETVNGFVSHASDTHRYLTFSGDTLGSRPGVGDDILTQINGKDEITKIKSRELFIENGVVVKVKLHYCHQYLIGTGRGKWSGIGSENRKPLDQQN